jgi:integrase
MARNKHTKKKGSPGVSSNNGILRISLPRSLFDGKQKYISTGLKDTLENREIAVMKANEIKVDILFNRFDKTLERYKPQSAFSPKKREGLTLLELNERHLKSKRNQVAENTIKNGYKTMINHLKRSPFADVFPDTAPKGFAQELCDWATASLTPDTSKRFIVHLNACLNWAIASGLTHLEKSPFEGMAKRLLGKKSSRNDWQIDPFTIEQRNAIIEHYRCHSQYSHYYLFVAFSFYVGCRPSEAFALQVGDVSTDLRRVTFSRAVIEGEEGRVVVEGLKTQDRRTIYCSKGVQKVLKEAIARTPNQLLFPGIEGGLIDSKGFRKTWRAVLKELRIDYRKPYQMRHSFITLCLEAGVNVKDVAKMVGNSPEVIYRHYAENRARVTIPDL